MMANCFRWVPWGSAGVSLDGADGAPGGAGRGGGGPALVPVRAALWAAPAAQCVRGRRRGAGGRREGGREREAAWRGARLRVQP